jgi:hypothetical protein
MTSIPLFADLTSFAEYRLLRLKFANGYDVNKPELSSFYITFCGETEYILCVRVFSTPTRAASGHGTILTLSANVGGVSASASSFSVESKGHCRGRLERLTAQRY